MWIKKPNPILGESLDSTVNFLYKEKKVFIMDNHLAAGWSWLNSLDTGKSHYLLHIDRHYDLLDLPSSIKSQVLDKNISLEDLSFQQYLDLKQLTKNGKSWPLFRWDNYILNLRLVYPNFFKETFFATHQDGNKDFDFVNHEVDFLELLNEIVYWIENKKDCGWILNLDIDYFFFHINERRIQIFTDELIIELMKNIKRIINKLEVLTICLSPECCGGWDKALEKTDIICDVLGLDFIKKLDDKIAFKSIYTNISWR